MYSTPGFVKLSYPTVEGRKTKIVEYIETDSIGAIADFVRDSNSREYLELFEEEYLFSLRSIFDPRPNGHYYFWRALDARHEEMEEPLKLPNGSPGTILLLFTSKSNGFAEFEEKIEKWLSEEKILRRWFKETQKHGNDK